MKRHITLGMKVQCTDGKAGRVSRLVTDPDREGPTYLVVKRVGIRRKESVVPLSFVAEVTADTVQLNITREALAGLPEFETTVQEGTYQRPITAPMWRPRCTYTPPSNSNFTVLTKRSVPEGSVPVEKGMAVYDIEDRELGTVSGVVLDGGERRGTHLILHRARTVGDRRAIPIELVAEVHEGAVKLDVTEAQVDGLEILQQAT